MLALAAPAVAGSSHKVTLFTHTADSLPFGRSNGRHRGYHLVAVQHPRPSRRLVRGSTHAEAWWSVALRRAQTFGRSRRCQMADRLTPLWRRCAGGCHLNRKSDDLI